MKKITVAELRNDKCPIMVIADEVVYQKKGSLQKFKFPTELAIVITNVSHYWDMCYVTYWSVEQGKQLSVELPKDFVFKHYDNEVSRKAFDDWMFSNLHMQLGHCMKMGSDPEIFVEDKNSGEVIPAFNFLGSKASGKDLTYNGSYGGKKMYWDGFQAEFETTPLDCLAYQVDSVFCGLKGVYDKAKAHNPNARLSADTVKFIPTEALMSAAEEHVTFGCMPSKNAYGMEGKKLPARECPVRSAGGHIHFGFVGKKTEEQIIENVKALDAILGVACVSLFAKYDNPARREFYGLAGEYRTPPHGLEYRVLSNAWLFHPLIMNIVFDLSRKVVVLSDKGMLRFWKGTEAETIECINTCNVEKAREILKRNEDLFIKLLRACYACDEIAAKTTMAIFMNGMESVVKDPTDLVTNWNLDGVWATHCEGAGKNWKHAIPVITKKEKVA
jgi:hypothetical protein